MMIANLFEQKDFYKDPIIALCAEYQKTVYELERTKELLYLSENRVEMISLEAESE
jgi:hypothetical protein